jgi:hypothetical protein
MGLRHASLFDAATAGALISQRLVERSRVAPVKREAVLAAGSFDSRFRVAEDSDLGLRLSRKAYYVRYVPEACAIRQHLPFTIPDLIRRAELYDETQLALLRKHPTLPGQRKQEVEDLAATLSRIDSLDFASFLTMTKGDGTVADEITKLFRRAAPFFRIVACLGERIRSSVNRSAASRNC